MSDHIELTPAELAHQVRFVFDNIIDGVRDESLLMWPAFDTHENKEVWVIGRKVQDKVMPVAVLLASSLDAVKRYAPIKGPGKEYDFSQIKPRL